MLAAGVRSGLEETFHDGAVAVTDPSGDVVGFSGDIDRPFFLRSSAKPFQAYVSQKSGADLEPIELAQACSSHRGFPVHIANVRLMLRKGGLDESALRCPRSYPFGQNARWAVLRTGEPGPRRIWSDCSGKHAGFLRACVANDWPLETYLEPDHPLQRRVLDFVSEIGDYSVEPVGVDGCGAPVLRTTVRAMSLMFARLGSELRLAEVFRAMHRYPALVSANGEGDASIATALNGAAKGGALGCIGVGLASGVGVAVKSWDGSYDSADLAAVAALEAIGATSDTASTFLEPVASPTVFGGDRPVGRIESRLELTFT